MGTFSINIKKASYWFNGLKSSEKLLVGISALASVFFVIHLVITEIGDYLVREKRITATRNADFESITQNISRYKTLKSRLNSLQQTFDKSSLTFEEVYSEIDTVVKESIGSDDYTLSKSRTPSKIGFDYERQDFTLKVKTLSLDQLVKLLHKLEQGEKPLFLGKVDLARATQKTSFSATLDIFSVRKADT